VKRKILMLGAAAACATGCANQTAQKVETPIEAVAPAPVAEARPKPTYGSFGIDVDGMDRSVRPGTDWFGYVNGTWAKTTEIPADRSRYGMFNTLDERAREQVLTLIKESAEANAPAGSVAQKVGDYYASYMDVDGVEARGAAPLQPYLAKIDALKTSRDLSRLLGEGQYTFMPTTIGAYVNQDAKDPDVYILYMVATGLGLPDRDYYLQDTKEFQEVRAKYVEHLARMLTLSGVPEAQAGKKAKGILDLETKIAKVHWNQVDRRDADKTYNKFTLAELQKQASGIDWTAFFEAAKIPAQEALIVSEPSAIVGIAKLTKSVPVATWKDYLRVHLTKNMASYLPQAFDAEEFAFSGTVLSGQPQQRERWKRGVDGTSGALGEAVGRLYVDRYFPPESKARADELVKNVIAAMDKRLAALPWMAPETREKARAKLKSFRAKIGYPDKWRDYGPLEVKRGDLAGNVERAHAFTHDYEIAKLGKPVDRDEWFMPPMMVNAYANPTMNEIVFPAAILQPPFFDANADDAVNYGGIGAVIGHEIAHHFDDQGRKFDATGRLTDWWTEQDVKQFKVYTDQLVAQYAAYEPIPGVKVNGELTLGENIADLAGTLVALDAYELSLGGKPAPVIDGFTGVQRFFMGHAQLWRTKYREPALRQQLVVDPHTAGHFRPNVARNLDAWYEGFDVQPNDALYLKPEERVRIW